MFAVFNSLPLLFVLAAPSGKVHGMVVDADSGEALIEAQLTVSPSAKKLLSDVDGKFNFELPAGNYTLRVFAELHKIREVPFVIKAEQDLELKIEMQPDGEISEQEVVVVATVDKNSEATLQKERRESTVIKDTLSAEQISRNPDSSAAEAAKRMVAATIENGRYIVLRGLGGRYSLTLLNGMPVPSPDPDVAFAPLDLFPTPLLANLTINKSFSADMIPTFAGGVLQLETRDFPEQTALMARATLSGDAITTFRPFLSYNNNDFFGFAGTKRNFPASIPKSGPLVSSRLNTAETQKLAAEFNNLWSAREKTAAPNMNLISSGGTMWELEGNRKIGVYAAAGIQNVYRARHAIANKSDAAGLLSLEKRFVDTGVQSNGANALVNAGYLHGANHRVDTVLLFSQSNDTITQFTHGTPEGEPEGTDAARTHLELVSRRLLLAQVLGNHNLSRNDSLRWRLNLSLASQSQPDVRDTIYIATQGGTPTLNLSGAGSSERFWTGLRDLGSGGRLDFEHRFEKVQAKSGIYMSTATRVYDLRRFRYNVSDTQVIAQRPEIIFAAQNAGTSYRIDEITRASDGYEAFRLNAAAYLSAEAEPVEKLRAIAGARYDYGFEQLKIASRFSLEQSSRSLERKDPHILPAAALIFSQNDVVYRLNYGQTVARPTLRELSPALYFDFARGRTVSGNPDLSTTSVHNLDARVERYFGDNEVIAASVFYKYFQNPIETTFKDQGAEALTYVNTPRAFSAGIELEARLSLERTSSALKNFFAGANCSIITSRINLDGDVRNSAIEGTNRKRALQGQAPYIVNLELGYRAQSLWQSGSSFNVVGPRIIEVGVGGSDDVYEQPFARVDWVGTYEVRDQLILKLSATNILNQRVAFKRNAIDLYGYRPGTAFSASLEWRL